MTKVRNGLASMVEALKRNGYMKADARYNQTLNASRNQVELEILIQAGDQYKMDRLTIKGLDVVTEPAVRKRWAIRTGDPFDAGYPAYFLSQAREMFDNLGGTDWKMSVDEAARSVDVELIFLPAAKEEKDSDPNRRLPL
jgi:hypothetical protein